jgi:FkbM family methyltransferase
VFIRNTQRFALPNITLYRCALGSDRKMVTLGTPMVDGVFRHGLTKIIENDNTQNAQTYQAQMEVADDLFAPLETIDFLKCDVEGYEVILFPEMIKTLARCKPLIQIEISSEENRDKLMKLLQPLGYKVFKLYNNSLQEMTYNEALQYEGGDFYFEA